MDIIFEIRRRHLVQKQSISGIAKWHQSEQLKLPDNLCLLKLPPYSPELNPVENLWDELREKSFGHLVFDSMQSLESHLETSLKILN